MIKQEMILNQRNDINHNVKTERLPINIAMVPKTEPKTEPNNEYQYNPHQHDVRINSTEMYATEIQAMFQTEPKTEHAEMSVTEIQSASLAFKAEWYGDIKRLQQSGYQPPPPRQYRPQPPSPIETGSV